MGDAYIALADVVSMDVNSGMSATYVSGLEAGTAILAGQACYLNAAGEVALATSDMLVAGSGCTAFLGLAPKDFADGDAITLYGHGARFNFSTGMIPGTLLFVSGCAGYLDDTSVAIPSSSGSSVTVSDAPVAIAVSATDIVIIR